jgi:hypothetical protein
MNPATSTKRIGMAMIDAATRDFIESGYMAIFNKDTKSKLFQLNPQTNLIVGKVREGNAEVLILRIEKPLTGKWEEVHHITRRGDVGETRVETKTQKPWPKNYLWIANELAMALIQLSTEYTVLGEKREMSLGGTGFSAIASEDVADAFQNMRNQAVRGAVA